jgi:peptidoglycan hydrolase-like protein with peptidoglycan-binding domain
MSALRTFWKEVVGIGKPNQTLNIFRQDGADSVQSIEQKIHAVEPKAEDAEQQADDDAFEAEIVDRTAAVERLYQAALKAKGPGAQQLQALLGMIKASVSENQFTEAGEALDLLDDAMTQRTRVAPAANAMQVDDGADLASAEEPSNDGETKTKKIIDDLDIIEKILGGGVHLLELIKLLQELIKPMKATCEVINNTGKTLILDETSLQGKRTRGEFKEFPPAQIPPAADSKGPAKFIAVSKKKNGWNMPGPKFSIRYFIGDQKTVWTIYFDHRRAGKSTSGAKITGPNKDNFQDKAENGQSDEAVFKYTLDPIGGPKTDPKKTDPHKPDPHKPDPKKPDPEKPRPPGPQQEVAASCLITVTNHTQVELKLAGQSNERGDFMTPQPAATLAPGDFTQFAYVTTPKETEADKQGCKGAVTYAADSPVTVVWRCQWENLVGEKNMARAELIPETAGFSSLEQPGQGDENVPFAFTISGGGAPKPDPKTPAKPEDELLFNPPAEDPLPTLREGDKNADGWVEYLQELLNSHVDFGVAVDGDFGPATLKALRAFQKKAGIQVDGVCGNQTWAALRGLSPPPSTDGREPHTFVDHGAKARWLTEDSNVAYYSEVADELELLLVSVGDQPNLEGQKVNVLVTVPGRERKGKMYPISLLYEDQSPGGTYRVAIPDFLKTYPSNGAKVTEYLIEAYFDKALGGDLLRAKPMT